MIIGLFLLFNPGTTLLMIVYYIGITKIISGGLGLFSHYKKQSKSQFGVTMDILYIAFGAILILSPFFSALLISIVPIIIGFWATITGITQIINSFKYKTIIKKWWIFLVLGILTAGFGIFVILNPILVVKDLIVLFGVFYLLMGSFIIYNFIMDRRNENPNVID